MRDKIKPEEIKSLRKSLKLSQQELADLLSISRRSISYWETGQKEPKDTHQALLEEIAKKKKKLLYIFDLPSLLKKEGKEDFLNTLFSLMRDSTPEYIAAACDDMQKVFLPERYKTFHTDTGEALTSFIIEFEQTKEIISALGISVVLKYGVETASIIATLTDKALFLGFEVSIFTSDVLLLQLLSPSVRVHLACDALHDAFHKKRDYDEERFKKEYGIEPNHYPYYLSLVGCKDLSIPGVSGIDEKSASELINKFNTIENVLSNLDKVEPKFRTNLQEDRAIALIGKKLALLSPEVELSISPADCRLQERDNEKLFSLAKEQSLSSLLQFLEESLGRKAPHSGKREYHTVLKEDELEELLGKLKSFPEFAIDFLTTSVDVMKAEIVGIAISPSPNLAYYIPVKNDYESAQPMLDCKTVLEKLKEILENEKISKIGHNIKYDFIVLRRNGISLSGIDFDTQIASYLLSPEAKGHEIDLIAKKYFGYSMTKIEDFLSIGKKQIPLSQVPVERVSFYACEYANMILQAKAKLKSLLKKHGLEEIFYKIEMPLISVLADMEMAGVKIDLSYLAKKSADNDLRQNVLAEKIFKEAGERFNIDSPKQLSFILFEKIGLRKLSKTKTGYSTKDTVLKELSKEHPLPEMILEYRQIVKLQSTIKNLSEFQNQETGRVHTSFNQAVTATGRLSSSNPNLQNIPVRTEEGREIRRAFVASEDNYILSADYSQIELRILAHLSKDERLCEAFMKEKDIHASAAALLFGVPIEKVTKEQRRTAKTMNYSIVYGISANSLAKELSISKKEAKKLIDNYFIKYKGVKAYFDKTIEEALALGYVCTIMGRRRYVPFLLSENRIEREFGKRAAQNATVQGSSADLIKVAMIKIADYLKKTKKKTKMLLSVHDELVFEVPQAELEEVTFQIKNIMETAIELSVPIKVDLNWGRNWLEAK
jgi:DNA polymerase-1